MARTPARRTAKPPARARSRAVSPRGLVGDSTYDIRFGIILDINGKSVPVTSGDLGSAKAKGVEFTLQDPITLGSIDDFETWVGDKFGVTLPKAADLPPPLDKVVGVITGMIITVEKAHVKVPGSDTPGASVGVTLEVNGTFNPEIVLITDKLGIQGMVFGFSNEAAET
jgi:hypothetical protein